MYRLEPNILTLKASPDLSAPGLQELSSNGDGSKDEIDDVDHGPGELEGEMNGDVVRIDTLSSCKESHARNLLNNQVPTSVTNHNTIIRSDPGQPNKLSEVGGSKEQYDQHTVSISTHQQYA